VSPVKGQVKLKLQMVTEPMMTCCLVGLLPREPWQTSITERCLATKPKHSQKYATLSTTDCTGTEPKSSRWETGAWPPLVWHGSFPAVYKIIGKSLRQKSQTLT